jgi:hypothetical protein
MRASTAVGQVLRLRLGVVLCTSLFAESGLAQPIQFGFEPPAPAELTPPRIDPISGPTAGRLEQARSLAAAGDWAEAVDAYRKLIAEDTNRVVRLDDQRHVELRTYCHMQLCGMPGEARSIYRRQVDPLAERWYREGVSHRDEAVLGRVIDELFCSSWGDDALLALGEIALERGDYAAARRYWTQISPLLRSPNGLPAWFALHEIDLDSRWPEVERRWLDRSESAGWLAYPDTQLGLADVRAKLALISIRAGQRERAQLELEVLRRFHPQASGRVGGQNGPYATALERLLTSADHRSEESRGADWRTFAGSPERTSAAAAVAPILRPQWPAPIRLAVPELARAEARASVIGLTFDAPPVAVRETDRPLSCFPIVVEGTVLFADAEGIHAADLETGAAVVTSNGVLYRDEPLDTPGFEFGVAGAAVSEGVPRYSLTSAGTIVYGRTGRPHTTTLELRDESHTDRLIGVDLARDGLLVFSEPSNEVAWSFDGVPLSDGRRVFAAMRQSDVSPKAYVACFDAASGSRLWRTSIAAADTLASGRGDEITHNLLTLVGERVYFNTNLGVVAALDAADGRIAWLHRYDRLLGKPAAAGPNRPLHWDRGPSPCMYHDGLLLVAPCDSPTVFALESDTGRTVWRSDEMPDALHLLGVAGQSLVVSGNRLWLVDVRSGRIRFAWPESEHAGIRGMGRGVLAGDEIFWPTRHEVYVLNAQSGERSRPPISLRAISENGANLVAARGRLIVAGYDKLMALGPDRTAAGP